MHPEFIKWLSEQRYRYYLGDPLNVYDTKHNWILDDVISFFKSANVLYWNDLIKFKYA